ncbi:MULTISPECIES: sensor histidine kinase [Aequorivita]|uniref:histidine kinase n=1 Tax=Aequorivita iocasae TaxID=2803865 RepID=A0ABX7DV81_9FLAO|nr:MULTISPECIES: HAMP domain-containing sensor histidine kinase [Aequorivita]QQX76669.1 HAMP domain-containing histidine kinase [Aequorivita iocasae]UCA56142.1 HAMP domain-containing histidine kinase [Aequorivita sp. F7]
MNKKLFVLLIALMSLSLLGIVFVQGYWISNAYRTKAEQFTINSKQVLISVAKEIQLRENEAYYQVYSAYVDSIQIPDTESFTELAYRIQNNTTNETYIFTDGILEQDYKLSSGLFDSEMDSIQFRKLTSRKTKTKVSEGIDGIAIPETRVESFSRMKDYERKQFEDFVSNVTAMVPIYKRVNEKEVSELIEKELNERGLKSKFEFAIYSNNLETKVRSKNFKYDEGSTYIVPLFVNEDKNNYELYVSFSEKGKLVLNSILGMAILSLVFTAVIILAYSSAISQIYKQRQISQIKSDFINNMTHEFKTPIATINLALDSLKNPKVKDNREFLDRYLGMIRDENRRMNAQVENVLRISKLEKNELDLPKERLNLQDIVEDAISHVSLIVEDRGGYINTHYGALKSTVLANESHLSNVIVNILDNAIKYSEEAPKIDVYSENVKNSIILKIRDQGMGMSKPVQKKIFEKFYREHTGDIHNVKGHGLGLAYVKRILDDHDAEIYVESEKGKGSTFIIKLHLIS